MLSGSRHLEGFQCLATDAGVHKPTNRFALGDDIVQGRNETADISRLVIVLTTAVNSTVTVSPSVAMVLIAEELNLAIMMLPLVVCSEVV